MGWWRGLIAAAASLCGKTEILGTIPATGLLCAYRTATHTSTGSFPIPADVRKAPHKSNMLTTTRGYEATSYQAVLQAKMAELQDLVEAHIAESANRTMTCIQLRSSSSLETWCGCQCPQQANLIRDGRETGQ